MINRIWLEQDWNCPNIFQCLICWWSPLYIIKWREWWNIIFKEKMKQKTESSYRERICFRWWVRIVNFSRYSWCIILIGYIILTQIVEAPTIKPILRLIPVTVCAFKLQCLVTKVSCSYKSRRYQVFASYSYVVAWVRQCHTSAV